MEPIPENGALLLFADLRPDLTETDIYGVAVVALAIFEYPTLIRKFVPDDDGNLVLPSGRRVRPVELVEVDERELGEGEPALAYSILELDARGKVIDDWDADDLEDAKAFLDRYPGAVWEELPRDRADALGVVQGRLRAKPQRP
jgi:hypothetical protein